MVGTPGGSYKIALFDQKGELLHPREPPFSSFGSDAAHAYGLDCGNGAWYPNESPSSLEMRFSEAVDVAQVNVKACGGLGSQNSWLLAKNSTDAAWKRVCFFAGGFGAREARYETYAGPAAEDLLEEYPDSVLSSFSLSSLSVLLCSECEESKSICVDGSCVCMSGEDAGRPCEHDDATQLKLDRLFWLVFLFL
jgi:hypothetical protein